MSMDASEFAPALAGADGEAVVSEDALLEAHPIEATLEAAVAATLDFAAIWPMRSGPFFCCEGQLAVLIASEFSHQQNNSATP